MFLIFLTLFSYYNLLTCEEDVYYDAKFNESLIIEQHHQKILEMEAFLKDDHRKTGDIKSALRSGPLTQETSKQKKFYYSTKKTSSPGKDRTSQKLHATKYTTPGEFFAEDFLSSPHAKLHHPPIFDEEFLSRPYAKPRHPQIPNEDSHSSPNAKPHQPAISDEYKYIVTPEKFLDKVSPSGPHSKSHHLVPSAYNIPPVKFVDEDFSSSLLSQPRHLPNPDAYTIPPEKFLPEDLLSSPTQSRYPSISDKYKYFVHPRKLVAGFSSSNPLNRPRHPPIPNGHKNTVPPNLKYSTIYPVPPEETFSNPGATSKKPPDHPTLTTQTTTLPTVYPPGYYSDLESTTVLPVTTSSTAMFSITVILSTSSEDEEVWVPEVAGYEPKSKLTSNASPLTQSSQVMEFTISPPTKRPPPEPSNFKSQTEIQSQTETTEHHLPPVRGNRTRKGNIPIADIMPLFGELGFHIGKMKEANFFLEDDRGFLYAGTTPENEEESRPINDGGPPLGLLQRDMKQTPTTIGDLIFGHITVPQPTIPSRKKHYYDMMDQYNEGYMMVFLIELFRLMAMKDPKDVQDVIVHTEMIINGLFQHGRLAWFDRPLLDVTLKLSILISEAPIDIKRSYAAMMHNMLRQRKQALSIEVNSIIDYADLLYTDTEGDQLFTVLQEFDAYPNTTKTGYELCDSLIENFLRPYRRLQNSVRRQALIDSINQALKTRFPNISVRKPSKVSHISEENDREQARRSSETSVSKSETSESESSTSSSESNPSESQSTIKKKRRQNQTFRASKKRKPRKKKRRHRKRRRHRHRRAGEYQELRRRKQKITDVQKRYSVVTSKYHQNKTKTTLRNSSTTTHSFAGRQRNSTHNTDTPFPYFHEQRDAQDRANNKKQPVDSKNKTDKNKNTAKMIQNGVTSYYRHNDKVSERGEGKTLKTELQRVMLEGSSYSDEEASLKMKLNQALQSNKTFDFSIVNKTNV